MNRTRTTIYPTSAQVICLRSLACVIAPVFMVLASMESGKDFIAHPNGGSDG